MSVVRYQQLPKATSIDQELIRYSCLEQPCVNNDVVITSLVLDTHAVEFHNADYIEINPPK